MSGLTAVRRGRLASAIVPVAAIGIAGIVVAQAGAEAVPRHRTEPALHAGPRIALGTTVNVAKNVFTEAPNGAVLYSRGSVVSIVNGDTRPKKVLNAGRAVLALAATTSDLFVQTGLTVTEYQRSDDAQVRHWTLPRLPAPVTTAGLFAEGGTLFSWIDTETDSSGLEFATISMIRTSASAIRVLTKLALPATMSANPSGLYFEATNSGQTQYFLGHASGGRVFLRDQPVVRFGPLPLALAGGRVDLLTFTPHSDVNTYGASALSLLSSKRVSSADVSIAGTGLGLLVLGASSVSRLNVATGAATGTVRVANAFDLLSGPSAAVIEVSHGLAGAMTLQRIS